MEAKGKRKIGVVNGFAVEKLNPIVCELAR